MNLSTRTSSKFYELVPLESGSKRGGAIIFHKRILVGRSDNCDLTILSSSVSAIHAVVEISGEGGRVYDMNSEAGTKVNGSKAICKDIKVGDKITFGAREFVFKEYHKSSSLPPVLDALEPKNRDSFERNRGRENMPTAPPSEYPPQHRQESVGTTPPTPVSTLPENSPDLKIPSSDFGVDPAHIMTDNSDGGTPYISYPLAKDSKAEFSEYIFEDADYIYPIFKWSIEKMAAEVIILHRDQIFSVDYLPAKKGVYYIKGVERLGKDIEFPYLRRDESIPFLRVGEGQVTVEDSLGHKGVLISDEIQRPEDFQEKEVLTPMTLGPQDILKLQKGDLQIFIRNSESPPQVKPAPLFRRDNESRKYFLLFAILLLLLLGFFSSITINKELEKEKQPERVATILYNRKKFLYKKRRVKQQKTKEVPKAPKDPEKKVTKPKPTPAKKVAAPKPTPKPKPTPAKKVAQPKPKLRKKVAKPKPAPIKKAAPKKVVRKRPARPKMKKAVTPRKNVAKATSKVKTRKAPPSSRKRKTRRPNKSPGHVEAYRPSNKFSGRLSRLLAKGGAVAGGVQGESVGGESVGISSSDLGGGGGSVERANVAKNVGSLEGAASGRLDRARGAEGLVSKKSVAVAGIPSSTVVMGDYDASVVEDILREHLPQFRYCYQKELDRANKISGAITLHFNIGASGRVVKAGLAKSALPASVEGCVVNVLKGIRFPAPLGGGVVAMRVPMSFRGP